jgi:FAD/FMN-containing dehydrogenase
MNKIVQYLNEHILGEATGAPAVRERFSRDGSILSLKPEIVVFPRATSDIRKIARFSWQLAEKGHILPVTVRGGGTDQTGAAIGRGIVIDTKTHLDRILHLVIKKKERVVHVQPGVAFRTLNNVLEWHGLCVPSYPDTTTSCTIGGAVASNVGGWLSGVYGLTGDWVERLEVVLANGDVIETSRINKRELSKKKGLQTLEGEIYRQIDGLIEDNQDLINEKLIKDVRDNTGYCGLSKVKQKDGSFDLTPLFIGSQGTLGIISEIILQADFYNDKQSMIVAAIENNEAETIQEITDNLCKIQPVSLEVLDGELFHIAHNKGKKYPFLDTDANINSVGAVIIAVFNDFNNHVQARKMKRAIKTLTKFNVATVTSDERPIEELLTIR